MKKRALYSLAVVVLLSIALLSRGYSDEKAKTAQKADAKSACTHSGVTNDSKECKMDKAECATKAGKVDCTKMDKAQCEKMKASGECKMVDGKCTMTEKHCTTSSDNCKMDCSKEKAKDDGKK